MKGGVDLVYEDADIQVLWKPGGSHFILITFGDLAPLADGLHFWGQQPTINEDISTIGIMAKSANWYPAESLRAANEAISNLTARYDRRVLIGSSMGGYAAAKFSRPLGATCVIAMSPQWSLDKDECDGVDPGWQEHFTDAMRGMGVRKADAGGRLTLFYDPTDSRDSFHAGRLAAEFGQSTRIPIARGGRNLTSILGVTDRLVGLLETALEGETDSLRQMARKARKSHPLGQRSVIARAAKAHPGLVAPAIIQAIKAKNPETGGRLDLYCLVLDYARDHETGRSQLAEMYDGFWPTVSNPVLQLMACSLAADILRCDTHLKSSHKTSLFYSVQGNACYHAAQPRSRSDLPIRCEVAGDQAVLFLSIGSARFPLGLGADRRLTIHTKPGQAVAPSDFTVLDMPGGCFAIGSGDRYMTAEPDGAIVIDRPTAKSWESFRFGLAV